MIGTALVGVVRTAERLGLLAALEQPATATQLARRLSLPERPLSLTLDVLRAVDITMLKNGVPFAAELTAFDPLSCSVIVLIVRDRDRMAQREKIQALGELVGGFSHDLNTPLVTLKANCALAQSLTRRLSGASTAEPRYLEALDAAATDALRALDDIASKLEAVRAFATLEGSALQELAPHFKSGLAHAICERAARCKSRAT